MGLFSFFTSKESSSNHNQNPTFDPNTLTMVQPSSPNAPSTEQVVNEQPTRQENMSTDNAMQLRGGGGGFCCGLCAGIACFECCEICC
ncbi:hypothetical protein BJY04DRAFT_184547 [Aspergillus karnatakaensis]|uniref:uncharacterized protein n=1 Tax=Aspergillus karnatakaensis TaxID=1810916 RepID=UPI003CCE20FD